MAVDAGNNSFVTGYFTDSTWFGSHVISTPGPGNGNLFLAKYSASGSCVWAKQDSMLTDGTKLGLDAAANIYIAALAPNASYTLSRWDSSGTRLWLTMLPAHIVINDLVTDANGNCWMSGRQTTGQSVFGLDTIRDTVGLIVHYDMNGNALGAVSLGKRGKIDPDFLALDANGNYVVAATLSGRDTLDGQLLNIQGTTLLMFTVDTTGNLLWYLCGSSPTPGNSYASPFGMCLDQQNNCYVTGSFVSQYCIFANDTVFIHPSGRTPTVMKIDATGALQWIIEPTFTGTNSIYFLEMTSNQNGVYFCGYGEEDFSLGAVSVINTTNSYRPGFAVALDFNGNAQYEIHSTGFNGIVQPRAIVVNAAGDLWFTGMQRNGPSLGPFTLPVAAPAADDMFLAKLQDMSVDVNSGTDPASAITLTNGAVNSFRLQVPGIDAQQQCRFVLYDLSGRAVKTVDVNAEQTDISCVNLAPGVYVWAVENRVEQLACGKLLNQ